jgi:hypothetical protein
VDPFLEQGAMFVTSRISSYEQTLPDHCTNQPTPDCQYVNGANNTFYIGNVEMMTLLLDHTFSSASLGVAQSAMSMPGKLLDQDGNVMNPCDDYTQQGWVCDPHVKVGLVNQGADVMPLRTLLRAAGINSLEETSPAIKETHRYAGLILVVSVQYSNAYLTTKSFLEGYYTYTYTVQSVQDAEFKAEQIIPLPGSGAVNRTILDRCVWPAVCCPRFVCATPRASRVLTACSAAGTARWTVNAVGWVNACFRWRRARCPDLAAGLALRWLMCPHLAPVSPLMYFFQLLQTRPARAREAVWRHRRLRLRHPPGVPHLFHGSARRGVVGRRRARHLRTAAARRVPAVQEDRLGLLP